MQARSSICLMSKLRDAMSVLLLTAATGIGQSPVQEPAAGPTHAPLVSLREVEAQVRELTSAMLEMRGELARLRAETRALRQELQEVKDPVPSLQADPKESRNQPGTPSAVVSTCDQDSSPPVSAPEAQVEGHLAKLEEDQQLLSAKIDEQDQTKVESASKYRVRLSGIALLNVFGNRGSVENQDVPNLALARGVLDSGGNFGATVRQSLLGLEVFGPRLGGAKTSANVQFDFFGGFPETLDGVTSGIVRLRTGTIHLDWARMSIVAGQDAPFFSPLSPSSLASLAVPAMAYSGNLWTWTPQVRIERRIDLSDNSNLVVQTGILDPLTGELPGLPYYRSPQAGERGRQPAYASRVAWTHRAFGNTLSIGAGGYYSRQNWGFGRNVDAWAGTTDWDLPLSQWFSLTGEFYRGRALGGLGGGIGRSILFDKPLTDPSASIVGLNSTGGWTQLKFKPTEKLEFNGAFGQDNSLASDLRRFYPSQSYFDASLARNRSAFVNFIYRAHPNLLFSVEFRRIWTFDIEGAARTADQVNLAAGVLF